MTNFSSLPPSSSDDTWKRVLPIEKDKRENESLLYENQEAEITSLHLFSFLLFLKKAFSKVLSLNQGLPVDIPTLIDHLRSLKSSFESLQGEDLSRDPLFTGNLHILWHNINNHFNQIKSPDISKLFSLLINDIYLFPPWEEHSLGFYLDHHAGGEWLPVPFMDILFSLYSEAQNNKQHNQLTIWIGRIEAIIDHLTTAAL